MDGEETSDDAWKCALHVVQAFGEGGGALGAHGDVVRQPHLLDLRHRHVHSLAERREDMQRQE
jgi:hypothetical protein